MIIDMEERMTINSCMGNPKNKSQCENCKRLPHNALDESDAKAWINWKKVKTPCGDFIANDGDN